MRVSTKEIVARVIGMVCVLIAIGGLCYYHTHKPTSDTTRTVQVVELWYDEDEGLTHIACDDGQEYTVSKEYDYIKSITLLTNGTATYTDDEIVVVSKS